MRKGRPLTTFTWGVLVVCVLLPVELVFTYDASRYSPFSSLFNNPYDYADAESYGSNLFIKLYEHMNAVKREQNNCRNIPVPKTVLNQKYFNPSYELMHYKYWYPPKDHQYVVLWAQYEAFRNSLFLSYMLQDNNAQFPPGWLYLYLSAAAQLHSLQTIGFNSHKSVKGIKIPFESNEVFKVNWWKDKGIYHKLEKPFAIYASQPKPHDPKYVRVVDFGTGGYSTDYTGHAFLESYLYDRQQFILNNTFEFSSFWKRPFNIEPYRQQSNYEFNTVKPDDPGYKQQEKKIEFLYNQAQQNQINYKPDLNENYLNNNNNNNNNNNYATGQQQTQTQQPQQKYQDKYFQQFQQQQNIQQQYQQQQQQLHHLQYMQQQNAAQGQGQGQGQYNQYGQQFSQQQPYVPSQQYEQLPYDKLMNLQQLQNMNSNNNYNYNYNNNYGYTQHIGSTLKPNIDSLDAYSPFVYQYKNNVPITSWDPIIDNDRNNLNRVPDRNSPLGFDKWYINSINQNIGLENLKNLEENPFVHKTLKWIDTYRFAGVWWNNESYFLNNQQEYVFRIKPEEKYYKFTGAKFEGGTSWTSPYFWCVDPTNWLVTARSPIWATNDHYYKNKLFYSKDVYRFVGLSEVVLNYEELDINQCPGDRTLNAFASTSLCDSTSECFPLPYSGLMNGGYECHCAGGFHYPYGVQGPYRGKGLGNNQSPFPLCLKSEGLLQYPNWVSKNAFEAPVQNVQTPWDQNYNFFVKREVREDSSLLERTLNKVKRAKRFIDRRNNFEKLRDSIFGDQENLRRRCQMMPFQDVLLLNEDDERFTQNLRYHADLVFKAQTAQALRIAHLISAYLQLHAPFTDSSSVNAQNDFSSYNNFGNNLRPDPQLEEQILTGEVMSTLMANYPIQEVNVFFNGSEFDRQKFFSSQNTLAFGLSGIRSDIELILNRTNDNSHLRKTWYLNSIYKYMYGGGSGKTIFGGPYFNDEEKNFFKSAGPLDDGLFGSGFKIERYGIEMNMRKNFDGMNGNVDLAPKFYDAASSGVWFGPYYDCQKRYMKTKTTLRMTYSVPIVTSNNKLPVGFVSVVLGSDLKWWRINPCDTSSNKNMFQNLNKCDPDTTICQYQEVPEFENGFYLASYRCICRANYEFPFMDYGSGYFEGATVEKEYEKKVKGMPNIFDRLKCRPIVDHANSFSGLYSRSSESMSISSIHFYVLLFTATFLLI